MEFLPKGIASKNMTDASMKVLRFYRKACRL